MQTLPVLNTPGQMRRAATPLLVSASGAPLIMETPNLKLRLDWIEGSHSFQYDQQVTAADLIRAFNKLLAWQEAAGAQLAPYRQHAQPPDGSWHPIRGGRFWWKGPLEALVIGKFIKTAIGDAAPRKRTGDDHLQDTGGRIAFRVGSYFIVREHLAEIPVRKS